MADAGIAGTTVWRRGMALTAAVGVLMLAAGWGAQAAGTSRLLFTGTFTDSGSAEGIYAFRFDDATGTLTSAGLAAKTPSPAWIGLHPNGRVLYAGNEVEDGFVSAFALDRATGALTLLNTQSAHGARPCHFVIDPSGRALIVASYNSGTVAVLPIAPDGRLGAATTVIEHKGSSVVRGRQEGPHAHQAVVDPSGRFVLVVDLGLDKVLVYRLDAGTGVLAAHSPAGADTTKGAGPRHLAFSKDGTRAYVINELDNTIATFRWDAQRGTLTPSGAAVPTLPAGYTGKSSTAEIEVHASGRFLYGSNRGHDSLARFLIDPGSGVLSPADHTPIAGRAPRHFAIDPSARWLLAAGQASNTIAVFSIDQQDGRLTRVGPVTTTPTPVCILFVP